MLDLQQTHICLLFRGLMLCIKAIMICHRLLSADILGSSIPLPLVGSREYHGRIAEYKQQRQIQCHKANQEHIRTIDV